MRERHDHKSNLRVQARTYQAFKSYAAFLYEENEKPNIHRLEVRSSRSGKSNKRVRVGVLRLVRAMHKNNIFSNQLGQKGSDRMRVDNCTWAKKTDVGLVWRRLHLRQFTDSTLVVWASKNACLAEVLTGVQGRKHMVLEKHHQDYSMISTHSKAKCIHSHHVIITLGCRPSVSRVALR